MANQWRLGLTPRQVARLAARKRDPRPVIQAHRRQRDQRERVTRRAP